jgi:hypothetical protein
VTGLLCVQAPASKKISFSSRERRGAVTYGAQIDAKPNDRERLTR